MTIADRLRPVLLQVGRELRREARWRASRRSRSRLLVAIKYAPGVSVRELAARRARLDRRDVEARRPARARRSRRAHARARPTAAASVCTLTDEGQRMLRRVRSRRTAWLASRLERSVRRRARRGRAAVEPLSRLLATRRSRMTTAARRTFSQPPLPQLPPLLRRSDRSPRPARGCSGSRSAGSSSSSRTRRSRSA